MRGLVPGIHAEITKTARGMGVTLAQQHPARLYQRSDKDSLFHKRAPYIKLDG